MGGHDWFQALVSAMGILGVTGSDLGRDTTVKERIAQEEPKASTSSVSRPHTTIDPEAEKSMTSLDDAGGGGIPSPVMKVRNDLRKAKDQRLNPSTPRRRVVFETSYL